MNRLLILVFLVSSVVAEDVYLKDGGFFKNVEISRETEQGIVLIYDGDGIQVPTEKLLRIDRVAYDPTVIATTNRIFKDGVLTSSDKIRVEGQRSEIGFNRNMIPISILSLYLAFNSFSAIDDWEGFDEAQDELRQDGLVYLAVGAMSVGFGLEFNIVDLPPDSASVQINQ